MERYQYKGPVTCDDGFDTSNAKGKTAVITGGANGMGEAYTRHLVAAGAFVVFGDIAEDDGMKVEADLKGKAQFVKCDVTSWKDQLALFKHALAHSPNKRIDIAIANAGITMNDDIFFQNADQEDPDEPNLKVMDINSTGVLYTTKLALHYFQRQFAKDKEASKDQILILQGSLAGYIDLPGAIQYSFSKYGLRSMMRNLRHTETQHGIRTNFIGPWFIKTKILTKDMVAGLESIGIDFAETEDAAKAVMKIVSDPTINGHSFAIVQRSLAKSGYIDLDYDDYKEGGLLRKLTDMASPFVNNQEPAPEARG